ncbi:hypothetical protein HNY73_002512 [Argiope bruennichi]|uniref:Uncharacterized protein n=1 Tax=Argiope bruennichi TaxID=94029 RepID=A0A8T0FWG9_ARGBR|nr:hypothetical protein HNY73_002512 [Argiope bruennichi]
MEKLKHRIPCNVLMHEVTLIFKIEYFRFKMRRITNNFKWIGDFILGASKCSVHKWECNELMVSLCTSFSKVLNTDRSLS